MAGYTTLGIPTYGDADPIQGGDQMTAIATAVNSLLSKTQTVGVAAFLDGLADGEKSTSSTNQFTGHATTGYTSAHSGAEILVPTTNLTYGKILLPAGYTALAWGQATVAGNDGAVACGIGYHTNVAATVPTSTGVIGETLTYVGPAQYGNVMCAPSLVTNTGSTSRYYGLYIRSSSGATIQNARFGMIFLTIPN